MRVLADSDHDLYYVADASGPTYGGYYAPFAIDPGLEAFTLALHDEPPASASLHMRTALLAAHTAMQGLSAHYAAAVDQLASTTADRLEAARQAADQVRPALWRDLDGKSLAHFGGQITACWFQTRERLVVGQVGTTRLYRHRGHHLEQLVADHSLATSTGDEGSHVAELAKNHLRVTQSLLGHSPEPSVIVEEFTVEPGDQFLLCTQDVYLAGPDLLQGLVSAELSGRALLALLRSTLGDRSPDCALLRIDAL